MKWIANICLTSENHKNRALDWESIMGQDRKMPGILIFAGTTEGRLLAEYVSGINQKNKGCTGNAAEYPARCFVCTATGYGKRILDDLPGVVICAGRMDSAGIQNFIEKNRFLSYVKYFTKARGLFFLC